MTLALKELSDLYLCSYEEGKLFSFHRRCSAIFHPKYTHHRTAPARADETQHGSEHSLYTISIFMLRQLTFRFEWGHRATSLHPTRSGTSAHCAIKPRGT